MTMIELNDYYSGGFFLVRRSNKPDWKAPTGEDYLLFVPEKVISLSTCFCSRVTASWGWIPGDKEAALEFGISPERLEEFLDWCGKYEEDLGIWSMFRSLESARRFIQRFLPNHEDLYLIEAGLPKSIEEIEWREEPSDKDEYKGIEERIEKHLPLVEGGTVLGFDVVSFSYGDLAHSWMCGHLSRTMNEMFGILPNEYGLIATLDEAMKIYEWIGEGELGTRGEPEPYDAWLLVSHPLT
jgi:hypothetical protein